MATASLPFAHIRRGSIEVPKGTYLVVGEAGGVVVVKRAALRRISVACRVVHRHCEADLHASCDVIKKAGCGGGRN